METIILAAILAVLLGMSVVLIQGIGSALTLLQEIRNQGYPARAVEESKQDDPYLRGVK